MTREVLLDNSSARLLKHFIWFIGLFNMEHTQNVNNNNNNDNKNNNVATVFTVGQIWTREVWIEYTMKSLNWPCTIRYTSTSPLKVATQ